MKTVRRKARVTKCRGEVRPSSRYTLEGVMRAIGIGRIQLTEARQAGFVKPIHCGRRTYYRGKEIIAWIDSHAE